MNPFLATVRRENKERVMTRDGGGRGISRNRARLIQSGVPQAQLQAQTMVSRQRHCPAYDIKKKERKKGKNVRSLVCNHTLQLSERSSFRNNLKWQTKGLVRYSAKNLAKCKLCNILILPFDMMLHQ